jgi:hypothetical protein
VTVHEVTLSVKRRSLLTVIAAVAVVFGVTLWQANSLNHNIDHLDQDLGIIQTVIEAVTENQACIVGLNVVLPDDRFLLTADEIVDICPTVGEATVAELQARADELRQE